MRNAPRRAGKNSRAERPVPAFRAAALRAGSDARRLRGDGPVGSAPRLSRGAARLRPGREAGGRARPGARFRRPGDEERGRLRRRPPRCRLARHAGLIAEVSLKVLPSPACELSLELEVSEAAALERMNLWAGQPDRKSVVQGKS